MSTRKPVLAALFVFAATVLLDMLTKHWVVVNLPEGAHATGPAGMAIWHLRNPGILFGLLDGAQVSGLVSGASVAGALGALAGVLSTRALQPGTRVGLALLAAGSLGNALDRLLYGSVVDFWALPGAPEHSLVINMADIAILSAAMLLFPASFRAPAIALRANAA